MWTSINKIIYYGVLFGSLRMLIGAISAAYLIAIGLDVEQVGYLKGFQALVIFFLDIPLAYFADTRSRKKSVVFAVFCSALWLFLMGIGTEIFHFYIAEFFNALSMALISGAFTSYLIDSRTNSDNEQSIQTLLGKYHKYQFIGMGVASFIGAAFIAVDSREIWIIAAIVVFMQFLFLSHMLPDDSMNYEKSKVSLIYKDVLSILANLTKHVDIKYYFIALFIVLLYYQILIQFWQLAIFDERSSLQQKGLYFGVVFTLILFVQSISGHFAEKFSTRTNNISVFFGILASTLIVLTLNENEHSALYLLPISVILVFFSNRLMTILLSAKIHVVVESKRRATYESVISTLVRMVLIFLLPATGVLISYFGKHSLILMVIITLLSYVYTIVRMKRVATSS